jgi:hypothetical protein
MYYIHQSRRSWANISKSRADSAGALYVRIITRDMSVKISGTQRVLLSIVVITPIGRISVDTSRNTICNLRMYLYVKSEGQILKPLSRKWSASLMPRIPNGWWSTTNVSKNRTKKSNNNRKQRQWLKGRD